MSPQVVDVKKPPTYLNESYIRQALEKAYGASITLKSCDIKLVSANGENFCSDIYRVHVTYASAEREDAFQAAELREKSLILKAMLKEVSHISSSEIFMYEKVLPKMEQILQEAGIDVKLKADCLLIDRVDKEVFVLEDLNVRGYHTENRWTGLDSEKTKVLLKKLAQWHAASIIFAQRFPTECAALQVSHLAENKADNPTQLIAMGGIDYVSKLTKQWEDFEEISTKMRAILPNFNKRMAALTKSENVKVKVITHGDLWVNNVLFNCEDPLQKDAIFVDFQGCAHGSPGMDINWLFNTSVQLHVMKNERYTLLRYYYKILKGTLKACGTAEVPTWQMIMEEVRNCEFLGFYTAVCEMPICCSSKEVSYDFTVGTFGDAAAMAAKYPLMYEGNERVMETLRYTLDRFNELGVLD